MWNQCLALRDARTAEHESPAARDEAALLWKLENTYPKRNKAANCRVVHITTRQQGSLAALLHM